MFRLIDYRPISTGTSRHDETNGHSRFFAAVFVNASPILPVLTRCRLVLTREFFNFRDIDRFKDHVQRPWTDLKVRASALIDKHKLVQVEQQPAQILVAKLVGVRDQRFELSLSRFPPCRKLERSRDLVRLLIRFSVQPTRKMLGHPEHELVVEQRKRL